MTSAPERRTIVLFHPRTLHERNYRNFHVPYSLLSLAAALDRARYRIVLLDGNAGEIDGVPPALLGDTLCVGISSMIGHQVRDGLRFARAIRQHSPSIPVVWGGPLPTILPQLTLASDDVDVVVRGQGQETFRVLVDRLADGGDLADVEGISYKRAGEPVENRPRSFQDVNRYAPFAAVFDLIDPAEYVRSDEHINDRTISYHASQGCPFRCGFCSEVALWGRRWSGLEAARILDDVEHLVAHHRVNGIKFYDAEFFIDRRRSQAFASGLLARGLSVRWAAAAHPRNLARLTEEEFAQLRRSGLVRLLVGAESGSPDELALVGKGTDTDDLVEIAKRCTRHQVFASFSFITGYPGMPASNIESTLRFAETLRAIDPRHETKVHFYAPYPGTPLYDLALKHGFRAPSTLDEWSRFDYYGITTPWVDDQYEPIVRQFNEANCPYVL